MTSLINPDIFHEVSLTRKVLLPAHKLNVNYDQYLLDRLKEKYEGKCTKEGFIAKGSIKLIDRSLGTIEKGPTTAALEFSCLITARVANPEPNSILTCKVYNANKMGVLAKLDPYKIIVAREYSGNMEVFENISVGQDITVEIIDRTFELNDKEIMVVARILSDDELANERLKNIKGKKNTVTENKTGVADDAFVESELVDDELLDNEDDEDDEEGPDDEDDDDDIGAGDDDEDELDDDDDDIGDMEGGDLDVGDMEDFAMDDDDF